MNIYYIVISTCWKSSFRTPTARCHQSSADFCIANFSAYEGTWKKANFRRISNFHVL